jgi:hypothetical protein
MRPWLLRPPLFLSGSVRLFSGSVSVMSSKAEIEYCRWLLIVGFCLRIAMGL